MKSMYDNEMELNFISKSNNEAFARITVAAFAAQLDPTIEELADIKTAVSEAVTNCIIHGYEDREGTVRIKAKLLENTLEVEIADNGKGIEDIELARKPLYTTKGNLERSGMGFTIMESFMDKVEIQSVVGIGTKIVMKKTIKREQKQEEIKEEENALIN
jgi:stage II sporulation protein AB (anti-sigma F factor)